MKNNELKKERGFILLREGWEKVEPQFDLQYFLTLDFPTVLKSFGYFLAEVTSNTNGEPLGFLSVSMEENKLQFLSSICPTNKVSNLEINSPQLKTTYPLIKTDYDNDEAAFYELTYFIIQKIIKMLGNPDKIIQVLGEEEGLDTFIYKDTSVNLNSLSIFNTVYLVYKNVLINLEWGNNWHDHGAFSKLTYTLKSTKLKELVSKVCGGIGIELNSTSYQIGSLNPKFTLDSFPLYIQKYIEELLPIFNNNIERFNILIEGPPGTGKTSWCQSFANEILSVKGYLIMIVDYNSLQTLVIPEYLSKVCLIVNDVDTLALDRSISAKGETEQIMSWLDGSRTSFIDPFFAQEEKSIITLMTANSVDRWDKAALRKGRIHKHFLFNQEELA